MEILKTECLCRTKWLSLYKRTFKHEGSVGQHFMVSRKEPVPAEKKKPDAVIVVAMHKKPDEPKRLVLTSEFRIPIGAREISFPAGLIDHGDYDGTNGEVSLAAISAAHREFKEETGLDLKVTEVSPPNLYSSGGMSDESVTIVFGEATGNLSSDGTEKHEDIQSMLLTHEELVQFLDTNSEFCYSKTAWPFLWIYKQLGF